MSAQPAFQFEPKTKRDLLREALLAGRKMSKQDILREFSIWNSGDQIMKLRREGLKIQTEMVTRGDNTYAIYFIEQE
jgi:hypothetical protein